MKTVAIDNSIDEDINKCITWQFDQAEHLIGLIEMIKSFFAQSTGTMWDDWVGKVLDISNADEFGLSVIGKIMNCPRPYLTIDGESVLLTTDQYRRILRARAVLLSSNGSVVAYKEYIQSAYNGHFVARDGMDCSLTFVPTANATAEQVALAEQFPEIAFVWPTGMRDSVPSESYVFGLSGQNKAGEKHTISNFGNSSLLWWDPKYKDRINIYGAVISGINDSYVYEGAEIRPAPTSVVVGTTSLVLNRDYTISYYDNSSPGRGTVIISGIGNYVGVVTKSFEILLNLELADVTLDRYGFTYYDGLDDKFAIPTVSMNGSVVEEGVAYTVSYENTKGPGLATVKITGIYPTVGERILHYPITEELCFIAEKEGTEIWFSNGGGPISYGEFKYKTDDDEDWKTWTQTGGKYSYTTTKNFQCVYVKGNRMGASRGEYQRNGFHFSDRTYACGWIESICEWSGAYYGYYMMFYNEKNLISAPSIWRASSEHECDSMFKGCTNLIYPPEYMPNDEESAYIGVSAFFEAFRGCENMISMPDLPCTRLKASCYEGMFHGCESVIRSMSALPATTLANGCYKEMFSTCYAMQQIPELPAVLVPDNAYNGMFQYCFELRDVTIPATTCNAGSLNAMFQSCRSLSRIEVSFTTWPSGGYTDWVSGVAVGDTCTFVKPSGLMDRTGNNYIPVYWTVVDK